MLTEDTLVQNRYLIVRQIGQGGMGAVYEARDQRLGSRVALKEIIVAGEALRRAFEREARLLAQLHHPALPVVIDHFVEVDGQFLVMQYIPGSDLLALLKENGGPFPPERVAQWGDRLLDTLEYLHGQAEPVIHRDIKPNNLKLTERGEIILLDFGLAKGSATDGLLATGTRGSVMGYTPHYAPLEQVEGTGTDERSDLYALAATLYHLLTGVLPPDATRRALSVVNGQQDPLRPAHEINPGVPAGLSAVLDRAMRQRRDERYASAAEMRRALRDGVSVPFAAGTLVAGSVVPTDVTPAAAQPTARPAGPETMPVTAAGATAVPSTVSPGPDTGVGPGAGTGRVSWRVWAAVGGGLALAVVVALATFAVLWPRGTAEQNQTPAAPVSLIAVDSSAASKDKAAPTPLTAATILGAGHEEGRFYAFTAGPGELTVSLDVMANGATVGVELFDEGGAPVRFDGSGSLAVQSTNYDERRVARLRLERDRRLVLRVASNYPKDVTAYRIRLGGALGLAAGPTADPKTLAPLATAFARRDAPTPLAGREISGRGSTEDRFYAFSAGPGELEMTLAVVASGGTVGFEIFRAGTERLQFEDNQTYFSLGSKGYDERSIARLRLERAEPLLLHVFYTYPNDVKGFRLRIDGPAQLAEGAADAKAAEAFAPLFAPRDAPTPLASRDLLGRDAGERYYAFTAGEGAMTLSLDVVANGSAVSVELFDERARLIRFEDNATYFSLGSKGYHERARAQLYLDRKMPVVARVTTTYPNDLKAFRLRFDGEAEIPEGPAQDPAGVAAFFAARDGAQWVPSRDVSGRGSGQPVYHRFTAGPGEVKVSLEVTADGGSVSVELFDVEEAGTLRFADGSTALTVGSKGSEERQELRLALDRKRDLLMRITFSYPNDVKEYRVKLDGAVDVPKGP